MLLRFRVENYKSFDNEQSVSMIAGISRSHPDHVCEIEDMKILRTAAIFGANASGKTNFIKAMIASKNMILGIPITQRDYCRSSPDNVNRPTSFEYQIELEGRPYSYGYSVSLNSGAISSEWLYDLSKTKKNRIFYRTETIDTDIELSSDEKKYFDVYSQETLSRKNILLLQTLSRIPYNENGKLAIVHKILKWFINSLRIIPAGTPSGFKFTSRRDDFTKRMMPTYGTGISGIRYEDLDKNYNPIPSDILYSIARNMKNDSTEADFGMIRSELGLFPVFFENGEPTVKRLLFEHNGVAFEYSEESDGTNRLFDLIPILDIADEKDLTYVIDELDRSMHPQLTKKFMKDFENMDKDLKRQLIITTHESRLMDQDLLRRDEIIFVNKNKNGMSEIYSLDEFNERSDRRIDKAYLDGRYDAIPNFKSIYPDLV